MELYKSKLAPGEEDKPDFSTRKFLATNKDFSFSERSINRTHSGNGSELTPKQVKRIFYAFKKTEVFKKSDCKKMWGSSLSTLHPINRCTNLSSLF